MLWHRCLKSVANITPTPMLPIPPLVWVASVITQLLLNDQIHHHCPQITRESEPKTKSIKRSTSIGSFYRISAFCPLARRVRQHVESVSMVHNKYVYARSYFMTYLLINIVCMLSTVSITIERGECLAEERLYCWMQSFSSVRAIGLFRSYSRDL